MLQIGKVLKSNGTEGGILIGWRDIDPEDIMPEEPVYIEFDGLPVPFFFESLTRRGQSRSIAKLSGVDSLKDAEELVGRDVLADYFEEEEDEGEDLSWMEGWTVRLGPDARGEVTGWMDIPGQDKSFIAVFTVDNVSGALLVPLQIIADYGYNMKVLHSRPLKSHKWQYYFYVEIEGDVTSEKGQEMMAELKRSCSFAKALGPFYSK